MEAVYVAHYFPIYVDFLRLENNIELKLTKTSNKISDELFSALKSNGIIIKEESKKGIHAECQLLSVIIKLMQTKITFVKEIYLGVSFMLFELSNCNHEC